MVATAQPAVSVWHRLRGLSADERPLAVAAMLCFFCVLSSYYVLRPVRDAMAIAGGVAELPWLFLGTLLLTLLLNPLFAWCVARLRRAQLMTLAFRGLMVCLAIFAVLDLSAIAAEQRWVGRAFYWWVSVFNVFAVSLFWTTLVDCLRNEQGRRLFGLVAAGGTVGAMSGAALTAALVAWAGLPLLYLSAALLLETALRMIRRVQRLSEAGDTEQRERAEQTVGGSALAGLRLGLGSPYLLGIAGFMGLYTLGSTFLYFLQADIVAQASVDTAERIVLFSWIDLAGSALTLLAQLLLTAPLIARLGVTRTLCLLPLLSLLGFVVLAVAPGLVALLVVQALRRSAHFAFSVPARELLYFPLPREARYKAKNLIDTFVFRSGDQLGAWAHAGLAWAGLALSGVSLVAAVLAAIWWLLAYWLGSQYQRRSGVSAAFLIPSPLSSAKELSHESATS